ncbi:hypothetical protein PoB_003573100 [Plakobranchus ocellatus]|uniref:Uncharacterized protein n=1 Tax=Plakobranchus ocellatus TaxID=259542 RepID=A0AAV4ARL3_9GAST|nr:hypothetical protein PoB_003573100 [Plakobranchus ocellatus]
MTGGAALPLQQTAASNLGNKYTLPAQVTGRSNLAENEDMLAENCTYPDFVGSQDLVPPENGYMADQPPRTVAKNPQFSNEWEITQARNFYLIASNNQFVQVHDNAVMGTNHQKPVLGSILNLNSGRVLMAQWLSHPPSDLLEPLCSKLKPRYGSSA